MYTCKIIHQYFIYLFNFYFQLFLSTCFYFTFSTDNGHNSTHCQPTWKLYNKKRSMIRLSLTVITIVLAIICLAYIVLLAIEKHHVMVRREERIYVNQIGIV